MNKYDMERKPEDYVKGLVSVITPLHNAEKYIERTLESVFLQTYKPIEIVIVDDQSSDKSAVIVKKYQHTHPEITYFRQSKNQGAGYARNKALELAGGQYVAFLDADDLWKPTKIEKQVQLLSNKKEGFCFTAIEMIDDYDNVIKGKRTIKEEIDYHFLLSNTMISTSSVMIDRVIMGDVRMHHRRGGQDYATWLKILRGGVKAYGINEALVGYRIGATSLSSNKLASIRQIWDIQTVEEGISSPMVLLNVLKWMVNSMKKYEVGLLGALKMTLRKSGGGNR